MQKESHSQSSLNINMNITGYVLVLCAVWVISEATFGIFKQKRKHRHGSFGGYLSDLKEVVDGILSFAPDFYETIPKVAHKLLHHDHDYEHGHSHKGHKHHGHDEYDDGHYHKEHKHHHHHHHKGSHYGPPPLPYHYGVPQYHYDEVPYGHGYPHLDHSIYNDPFHLPETHSVGHLYNNLNSLHHDGLIYK